MTAGAGVAFFAKWSPLGLPRSLHGPRPEGPAAGVDGGSPRRTIVIEQAF